MNTADHDVILAHRAGAAYPASPPFHPDRAWPEYPFDAQYIGPQNTAYAMVREVLHDMQLDANHYDQPGWNPLGEFIQPGQTVVIKPNLVQDRHYRGGDIDCLITHGSVVRAVMDYVYIALQGRGRVVLGDAPVLSTRFDKALEQAGLPPVIDFYRQQAEPKPETLDFRLVAGELDPRFHVTRWVETPGDPSGNVAFDLGTQSLLAPISHLAHLFRLPHYRKGDTEDFHGRDINRFVVPRCIMDAHVIVNLPKMKTHCKAGITGALKNFVGIVALRHCYTNYRRGAPKHGGDEYPRTSIIKTISEYIERLIDGNRHPTLRPLLSIAFRVNERIRNMLGIDGIRDGAWHGNDTVWRAILDLVRIARYGTPDGTMATTPQRTLFTLIDGLTAGEDEGPLEARSKQAGCLLAGFNPVALDAAMAALMGYDFNRVTTVRQALTLDPWPLISCRPENIRCRMNGTTLPLTALHEKTPCTPFVPPRGWIGHIEMPSHR